MHSDTSEQKRHVSAAWVCRESRFTRWGSVRAPGKQQKGWGRTWSSPLGSSGVRGERNVSATQGAAVWRFWGVWSVVTICCVSALPHELLAGHWWHWPWHMGWLKGRRDAVPPRRGSVVTYPLGLEVCGVRGMAMAGQEPGSATQSCPLHTALLASAPQTSQQIHRWCVRSLTFWRMPSRLRQNAPLLCFMGLQAMRAVNRGTELGYAKEKNWLLTMPSCETARTLIRL